MKKEGAAVVNHSISNNNNDIVQKCWSCEQEFNNRFLIICDVCDAIQDIRNDISTETINNNGASNHSNSTWNYYHMFGLECSYIINNSKLDYSYYKMQGLLHPDNLSTADKEQELRTFYSSLLNQAYNTLVDPYLRGGYFLRLNNISTPQQNSGATIENSTLLTEMLELSEQIDTITSLTQCQELRMKLNQQLEQAHNTMNTNAINQDWQKMHDCMHRYRYLQKHIERVKDREQQII